MTRRDWTREELAEALEHISPHMPRAEWAEVAMGLKSHLGDDGRDLFYRWSAAGGQPDDNVSDTWRSVKGAGGKSIGYVIMLAKQGGWEPGKPRELNEAERVAAEERARQRKARQDAEERERRQRQGEAARHANLTWDAATPDGADEHLYPRLKGTKAHGLRVGEWPLFTDDGTKLPHALPGTLIMPIYCAKTGKVISLEGFIPTADGEIEKRYLKHGRKRGGFYMIGEPRAEGILAFCEGYATGATIHELTKWPVVVCMDAPNIPTVAEIMRPKFEKCAFLFCADDDRNDIQAGEKYANEAAKKTGGFVILPQFSEQTLATKSDASDFNDLAALEGAEVARAQLLTNPIAKVPANDNTPQTVDYYTPLIDINGRGKPLATIENVREICRRLGVIVRYNMITKSEELIIPGESFSIDNRANASIAWLESWCERFEMPTGKLSGFVTYLADKNLYNPVATWITSKPWDGVSRIQEFCNTVIATEDKRTKDGRRLSDVLILRWMMSAIAAAFNPEGVAAQGMLVFTGKQNLGKTTWFNNLTPRDLELSASGKMLDPSNKDHVKQVCSYWLVELGELDATFRKSDIAALKAFITRNYDELRLAYARKESKFVRRTVLFGSVNSRAYLHDDENRRYWTIEIDRLDTEAQTKIDMQQVWAECLARWKAGEPHWLLPDEAAALRDHNETFKVVDPIEERLQTRLNWGADSVFWEYRTATQILLSVGVDRPTVGDATKAANYLRKMNGNSARRSNGQTQIYCPPMATDQNNDAPY